MNWAPLSYLTSAGTRAANTVPLTWFTLIVSVFVCLIVGVLLLLAVIPNGDEIDAAAVTRSSGGLRWISTGLILSAIPLAITLVWTMAALAKVSGPPERPALVLDVTGRQWWWEVRYNGAPESQTFTTANEIHIPVGVPVRVNLHGGDVIHSFWVPQLAGKTDTIPGQTNVTWLQATLPGRYRGQCTEFCGLQHAKMGFEIVAEPRDVFERWRVRQLQTAPPPCTSQQARGLAFFQFRCGLCHAVRGTEAASNYGPDLTHVMSRRLIAAGTLPNNPGALAGWIQAPQGVKPGSQMPDQHLTGAQLNDVRAYLETLQ